MKGSNKNGAGEAVVALSFDIGRHWRALYVHYRSA
jgi:hypothetical protein